MSRLSHALNSTLNFSNKLLVITYAILIINDIDWPVCSPYQNGPDFLPCSQRLFSEFSDFFFSKNWQFQIGFRFVIQEKAPLSTYKFSTLNCIHLIGRHFINSHYLSSWLSIDFVKGKLMLITLETWERGRDFPPGHDHRLK